MWHARGKRTSRIFIWTCLILWILWVARFIFAFGFFSSFGIEFIEPAVQELAQSGVEIIEFGRGQFTAMREPLRISEIFNRRHQIRVVPNSVAAIGSTLFISAPTGQRLRAICVGAASRPTKEANADSAGPPGCAATTHRLTQVAGKWEVLGGQGDYVVNPAFNQCQRQLEGFQEPFPERAYRC